MKKFLGIASLLTFMLIFPFCGNGDDTIKDGTALSTVALGDTSHIAVYFTKTEMVQIFHCTEGETLYIPCQWEDDGMLEIICQDNLFVVCGDTSHVP